eukprot:GHVS01055753.1.p1 GENE.GHVS01055753.1~~GHVS01055753.1.p1  ORF type:complete len:297 (+),score=81.25 GHVS01055753.1:141-1031(+)
MRYITLCPQVLILTTLLLLYSFTPPLSHPPSPSLCYCLATPTNPSSSSYSSKRISSSSSSPPPPPPLNHPSPAALWNRWLSSLYTFFTTNKSAQRSLVYSAVVAVVAAYFLFTWGGSRRPHMQHGVRSPAMGGGLFEGLTETRGAATSRRPKVSIALNALVLDVQAEGGVRLHESQLPAFQTLCGIADLYAFAQVKSDEEEQSVHTALAAAGVVGPDLLQPHRLMYSSTIDGRSCMVRQLQPSTHIDCEDAVIASLAGKVPNVVKLRPHGVATASDSAQTLQSFVKILEELGCSAG